jgi:ABC-type Fe3+-hydroxamate transport system substrate-binding protein
MPVFTDRLGQQIILAAVPERIVSLVPSQTELLYDLGLDKQVVGITKFCVHPQSWYRSKERVGGTKNIHIETVRALQPDLIIANKEENIQEQVEALRAIAPVWTSDVSTLEDALDMIRTIGLITGKADIAESISRRIGQDIHDISLLPPGAGLRTAYLIWQKPWMTIGGDTFISNILHKAGFHNVFSDMTRYPEIRPEDIRDRNTQLVLLSSEPYPFRAQHVAGLSKVLPGIQIRLADGEMFSWYGSRLLHLKAYLRAQAPWTSPK